MNHRDGGTSSNDTVPSGSKASFSRLECRADSPTWRRSGWTEVALFGAGTLRASVRVKPEPQSNVGLRQKPGSFGGGWHAAGFVSAEESVAVAGDQVVTQIAKWQRDQPQQSAEDLPAKTQLPEDSHGGG